MRFKVLFLVLILPLFAFKAGDVVSRPDISTPEKSFQSFVSIIQTGETESLEYILTPTGFSSLASLSNNNDYRDGVKDLGKELADSNLDWAEITEDIYFLKAEFNSKTHKLEFTKEASGWMLYHWQLGGGVDELGEPSELELELLEE